MNVDKEMSSKVGGWEARKDEECTRGDGMGGNSTHIQVEKRERGSEGRCSKKRCFKNEENTRKGVVGKKKKERERREERGSCFCR